MNIRTLTLVTLALLFVTGTAASQPVSDDVAVGRRGFWLVGSIGGFDLNSYTTDNFFLLNSEAGWFAENGSGMATWGGLDIEYCFGPSHQDVLMAQILYDSKSSEFRAVGTRQSFWAVHDARGIYDSAYYASARAELDYITAMFTYRRNFFAGENPWGPGMELGATIGFPLSSKLVTDGNAIRNSGDQSHPDLNTTTSIVEAIPPSAVRIAVRGALTYDIPFSSFINAQFMLGYDLPITKVNGDHNWYAASTFAGLAIRYALHE